MADRNGCILMQQQQGQRLTDNVTSANHDRLPAFYFNPAAPQQLHHPRRRAGTKAGQVGAKFSYIDGMETVDVLQRVNGVQNHARIDPGGQRKLHQYAINRIIYIEELNLPQKFGSGKRSRKIDFSGIESKICASLNLTSDVNGAGGIVSDQHGRQPRPNACVSEPAEVRRDFGFYVARRGASIQDRGHWSEQGNVNRKFRGLASWWLKRLVNHKGTKPGGYQVRPDWTFARAVLR
jgi:hypothetical protein